MNRETEFDVGQETSQLLARLDEALDRSCLLRDELRHRQRLADTVAVLGFDPRSRLTADDNDSLSDNTSPK